MSAPVHIKMLLAGASPHKEVDAGLRPDVELFVERRLQPPGIKHLGRGNHSRVPRPSLKP